jgi:hypothetical protein
MGMYLDTRGLSSLAIGICGRCSLKFPVVDLMPDPNSPGLLVCRDDVDDYDPYRLPPREVEDITLLFVRPDEPLTLTLAQSEGDDFEFDTWTADSITVTADSLFFTADALSPGQVIIP